MLQPATAFRPLAALPQLFHFWVSGINPQEISASDFIPEICFSDDRRLFASSDAALAHIINVVSHGCWKAGAAVNGGKLQAFKVRIVRGRLTFIALRHKQRFLEPLKPASVGH
jgi:hypothetical protein